MTEFFNLETDKNQLEENLLILEAQMKAAKWFQEKFKLYILDTENLLNKRLGMRQRRQVERILQRLNQNQEKINGIDKQITESLESMTKFKNYLESVVVGVFRSIGDNNNTQPVEETPVNKWRDTDLKKVVKDHKFVWTVLSTSQENSRTGISVESLNYKISKKGISHFDNLCEEYLCWRLPKMQNIDLVLLREIPIPEAKWCNRITYIDGDVVVPYATSDEDTSKFHIHIDAENINREIKWPSKIGVYRFLKKVHNGEYILGTPDGLLVGRSLSSLKCIVRGSFTDMTVHDQYFSALRVDPQQIVTFHLELRPDGSRVWEVYQYLFLGERVRTMSPDSTLVSVAGEFYVSGGDDMLLVASLDHCQIIEQSIPTVTAAGSAAGLQVRICGKDINNHILLSNYSSEGEVSLVRCWVEKRKLHKKGKILSQRRLCRELCWSQLRGIKVLDVAVDPEDKIWILAEKDGGFSIQKYGRKDSPHAGGQDDIGSYGVWF